MKDKFKKSIELFLFFFKIGCFTFGGGWSILAQMDYEFIQKKHIITKEELLDITSVGRSMPGIMITNISIIFGYRVAGIIGAIAATLGIAFPSIIILTVVTYIYALIKDNIYIKYILSGIRSAVVPIIAASVISMWKAAIKDKLCFIVCLSALVLSLFSGLGNIQIVLLGILVALIMSEVKKHGTI